LQLLDEKLQGSIKIIETKVFNYVEEQLATASTKFLKLNNRNAEIKEQSNN